MQDQKDIKPQLHQSHLAMLYRCGEKFSRVVIEGEKEPATIPLVVGGSTHFTVARNLTNVIDKGTLLTKEAVQDYARDDFQKEWQERPVVFNAEEISQGLKKTKDKAQDVTIGLVTAHHYDLAPLIRPKAVERKWVLNAKDYKYDLAGMIDVDEGVDIRDTKTCKNNLGQRVVDVSEQYTFYALAKYMIDGYLPEYVHQDNIVKPTKTRAAYCSTYRSTRTKDDFVVVMRRFDQATKIIASGSYTPSDTTQWWCSPDFCGFFANGSCPYANSKRIKKQRIEINPKDSEEKVKHTIESLEESLKLD